MQLGFIGLGAMGLPMARHLVEAGHEVKVASRSPGPVEAAAAFGATRAVSLSEIGHWSEVLFVCVPSSPDVDAVVGELVPALGPGTCVVDCSTIDPDVESAQHERVRARGADYLDAPLSGGTTGAQSGTLTVMVGGEPTVLDRVRVAFDPFAGRVVHVGGAGMGQVVKLANNLVYAAQMLAVAEAVTMAQRAGADMATLYDVLSHSTGDCAALRSRFPVAGVLPESPASNDWAAGFTADLMAKDLDLAIAFAGRLGVELETTELGRRALAQASAQGLGGKDFSALAVAVAGRVAPAGTSDEPVPGAGLDDDDRRHP